MNIPKLIFRLLLGRRYPITTGTLEVSGINKPVLIRRDEHGIAYIEAESDEDAWYGLGFCHGQDRAFQLEALLRVVRGTMAELVGPAALPIDRLSRRIGFRHAAERQLELLDDEIRQMVEAYAQGATAGARAGCRRLAHEFVLLRAQPTPYSGADALGLIKLMSFNLASNWDSELVRLKTLTEDGPEALVALDPASQEWLPATSPPAAIAGRAIDRLVEDLAAFTATVGHGGGSNNWAIAPSRTGTGRPILANDPHLAPTLPSYWYLAHIRTPDWAVAGASFVGAPTFPVGHNSTAAWGMTAGLLDNTDLFIEEVGPDGRSVRQGDRFVPCEIRREVIQVKGEEPVVEEVLITSHGPIIGPVLEGEVGALSLRAIWLDPRPVNGLFQIHRARSFEEFRRAFERWPALPLNMVYADTFGTIGWQLVGEAPRRRKGWGTLPLAGWDPEVGWEEDPVPFDQMPHLADPDSGFIATANTQPTPDGEGPFLGIDWVDGYRLARIVQVLDARHDWDLAGAQAFQMDQKSLPWQELRDTVLALPADTGETRQALALLEAWDGVLAADSPAAAVFEFFLTEMIQRVVKAKATGAAQWALGEGFTPLIPRTFAPLRRISHLVRLVREQPEGWFERSWPEEMADGLATAIRTLRQRHGDDSDRWGWGHVRPLTLRHAVGEQAPMDRVFNRGPFPCGGDASTVSQACTDLLDPGADPLVTVSLRMVADVGNWDEGLFVLPGGQSGNPLSPHYDDLLPLWQQGKGVHIAWSPEKVEQATRSTLRLEPR